jgi:hypothetical protein
MWIRPEVMEAVKGHQWEGAHPPLGGDQ